MKTYFSAVLLLIGLLLTAYILVPTENVKEQTIVAPQQVVPTLYMNYKINQLLSWGLPIPEIEAYQKWFQKKYGVETVYVAWCLVNDKDVTLWENHNTLVKNNLKKTHPDYNPDTVDSLYETEMQAKPVKKPKHRSRRPE